MEYVIRKPADSSRLSGLMTVYPSHSHLFYLYHEE